ncbi:SRA-YDG, partial [Trametes sanguinea]
PRHTNIQHRRALFRAGVHAALRAGIHGQHDRGAFSIVMSGGYEDDQDYGSKVIYVGTGGLEKVNPGGHGAHISDQTFDNYMNKSLLTSMHTQQPVRLVRGWELKSKYAPQKGYRYDGLYTVKSAKMQKGRSGFQICVFELERVPGQPPLP